MIIKDRVLLKITFFIHIISVKNLVRKVNFYFTIKYREEI